MRLEPAMPSRLPDHGTGASEIVTRCKRAAAEKSRASSTVLPGHDSDEGIGTRRDDGSKALCGPTSESLVLDVLRIQREHGYHGRMGRDLAHEAPDGPPARRSFSVVQRITDRVRMRS